MDKQKIISVLEDLVYEDINNEDYWKAVKEAKVLIKELKQALTIPAVVVSEERAELCDNPNCEDGIVDRDYYGHPIYCQVCESHN